MMSYATREVRKVPDGSGLEVLTERVRVLIWSDGTVVVCLDNLLTTVELEGEEE